MTRHVVININTDLASQGIQPSEISLLNKKRRHYIND